MEQLSRVKHKSSHQVYILFIFNIPVQRLSSAWPTAVNWSINGWEIKPLD
jgi:hypothetical protein